MGEAQSICCQDTADHKNIIGIVNEPTWGDYYEAQWPDNEEIKHFLAGSEGSGKYTDKVRKHRSQEKYYQGDWENEQPKGQGVIYALDKFYYEGGFDGTPHGSGKLELIKEGVVYQGQINHGKADGEGKIHSKDDRYCFEGQWQNSCPKTGTLRTKLPNDSSKENIIELKNYPIGDTSITYHDGRKYVGKIHKKTLAPDGKGKATFTDGSYYEGDWTDGEMNGKGDFYWPDGSYYIGEYQNGRKHGVGEFKFPSGKIYKGQWADGKQNGKGKLTDKDWSILKDGEWKEGVYQHV